MIPKVNNYIRYYDSAFKKEMFAWVDGVHYKPPHLNLQCDDGWNGYRGTSCKTSEVLEILPDKTRTLSYFKMQLCFNCEYNHKDKCDYSVNVYCTDKNSNCPYKMEFAVFEAEAKELA